MRMIRKAIVLPILLSQVLMLAGCNADLRMDLPQDKIEVFRNAKTASIHVYTATKFKGFGRKLGPDDSRFLFAKYMLEYVGLNVLNAGEADQSVDWKKASDVTLFISLTRTTRKVGPRYLSTSKDFRGRTRTNLSEPIYTSFHEMGRIKISAKGGPSDALFVLAAHGGPGAGFYSLKMLRQTRSYLYRLMEMIYYIYGSDPICKAASFDGIRTTDHQEDDLNHFYYMTLSKAARIFIEYEAISCPDGK